MKIINKIYEAAKARRDANGEAIIDAKDCGKIIKARLTAAFPGVKFSVKTDHNTVDIYWTDGPTGREVEAITDQYSFGGFDGMIDMAYDSKNWLLADGSMMHAATSGTEGSRGTVSSSFTDCPVPGAILVKYGPRYVFTHRDMSDEYLRDLVDSAADYYGFTVDATQPIYNQHHNGDYLPCIARRYELELQIEHAA